MMQVKYSRLDGPMLSEDEEPVSPEILDCHPATTGAGAVPERVQHGGDAAGDTSVPSTAGKVPVWACSTVIFNS